MSDDNLICNFCEAEIPSGKNRCVECGRFTFANKEEEGSEFMDLADVEDAEEERIITNAFFSDLFGGGFVESQRLLIGGEAGGGKTTFAQQLAELIWKATRKKVLYLATEQKPRHIKAACKRIGVNVKAFRLACKPLDGALECLESDEEFGAIILDSLPDLIGVDPNEAIEVLKRFQEYGETHTCPIFIIDHVSKGQELAGLYRLLHTVDTVVYLRYDGVGAIRVMEIHKNRFGQSPCAMQLEMRPPNSKNPGRLDPVIDEADFLKRGKKSIRLVQPTVAPTLDELEKIIKSRNSHKKVSKTSKKKTSKKQKET
jgi:predicted ATP-dependent serine protease